MQIDWVKESQPESMVLSGGCSSLTTPQILSLLISCGDRKAIHILTKCPSLRMMAQMAPAEMCGSFGILPGKAAKLCAALEISKRCSLEKVKTLDRIEGADDAYAFLKPHLSDLPHESFGCIMLNQKHSIISYKELFRGTINGAAVHAREIIKETLRENAAAVILAHNHPSGNTVPSPEDINLTEQLETLLDCVDVRCLDHIIVGHSGYYSFAREGLLPTPKK